MRAAAQYADAVQELVAYTAGRAFATATIDTTRVAFSFPADGRKQRRILR
jgi:hypothetical protein